MEQEKYMGAFPCMSFIHRKWRGVNCIVPLSPLICDELGCLEKTEMVAKGTGHSRSTANRVPVGLPLRKNTSFV